MPLNGGGTASKPAGTTAVPNSTISSAPFNSVIDDIYAIFNTPRPIAYGGTNGTDIATAQTNLNVVGYSAQTLTEAQKLQARTNIGAINATPGNLSGLAATTNVGTPATHIDVAPGGAASSASPYYFIELASSITKNTNSSWAVGSGNGSLDTGSIANSQYFGYLIQRSDTGVVDVLTSLSSTSPTMPANYDRRSPALFTFVRNAGVNGTPTPMPVGRNGYIKLGEVILGANAATIDFIGMLTSVYDHYRVEIDQTSPVTNTVTLRMTVSPSGSGGFTSSGYLQGQLNSDVAAPTTGENNLAFWQLTQNIITTAGNGANGWIDLARLGGAISMTSMVGAVTTGSTLRTQHQSGLTSVSADSLRFFFSSGNILANSRIRLYGMAK